MPLSNPVKPTFASVVTGTAVAASGLTGAASQSRLVGGNASGAPASGTFAVGDHVANADGTVYVCTVAGTPGTWVQVGIPAYGTPGSSAVGDTAAAGSATTVARSDHLHGREAFGTPVNIDASLTSLSAGSLTTVARADHVHTVSNVAVLIGTAVISSSTASYTFSSIPQTYQSLLLITSVNCTSATTVAWLGAQFNGDTAANYATQGLGSSATSLSIGMMTGTSNFLSTANAETTIFIPNYRNTTRYKGHQSSYMAQDSSTSTLNWIAYSVGGYWKSTAAITSIKLLPTTGSFGAGTLLLLYGLS